jgi:hypothetical protein
MLVANFLYLKLYGTLGTPEGSNLKMHEFNLIPLWYKPVLRIRIRRYVFGPPRYGSVSSSESFYH